MIQLSISMGIVSEEGLTQSDTDHIEKFENRRNI
jgi:hypothetical protein